MSKYYLKVPSSVTLKDAIKIMHDSQQNCVLVVDEDDFLEGILTYGDIRRCRSEKSNNETSMSDSDVDVCKNRHSSLYIEE
jgi:signal-transduction protein with cAMP-binding, CBS, and nucleotidyltransferase domain